jgi:hypothetical protein
VAPEGPFPDQGKEVRAYLDVPGQFELQEITVNNVVRVDGEVIEFDDGQLWLSGFWFVSASGLEHKGVGETVAMNLNSLGSLERKRFSIAKSVGLAGAFALISILLQTSGSLGGGSEGGGPDKPSVR